MSTKRSSVFDYDEALHRVDQDLETFLALVELFIEHGPKDCAAIKAALEARDAASVARSAHRLKGSVMQFCAPATFEAAKKLEALGQAGTLTEAGEVLAELELELGRLLDELRRTWEKGLAA